MLSARKGISLLTGVIKSQLIDLITDLLITQPCGKVRGLFWGANPNVRKFYYGRKVVSRFCTTAWTRPGGSCTRIGVYNTCWSASGMYSGGSAGAPEPPREASTRTVRTSSFGV